MIKPITKLMKRYAHVETYTKRKMAILALSIGTFFVCMVVYFTLQEILLDHSVTRQVVSVVLGFLLVISGVFLYHRYQQHAVNTFILYLLGLSLLFIQYEQLIALYVLLVVSYLIIRIIHVKTYQIISYSLLVSALYTYTIIDSWAIQHSRILGIQLLFSALVSIVIIGFIYTFIGYVESEIKRAGRVIKEQKVATALHAFSRRKMDDVDVVQKLTSNVAVLMVGIDDMVSLGDAFIEEDVQQVLKGVVGIIRSSIRIDDYIIRWDPSTFLVILHYISETNASIVAEKIRRSIKLRSKQKYQYTINTTIFIVTNVDDSKIQDSINIAYERLLHHRKEHSNSVEYIK